ncbi:MAG: DUF3990 domain-containing protein [Oscillospiraceae bacterium]|nr:DUF3990 domain-containing protein [Oscillospiraceae bacterium]
MLWYHGGYKYIDKINLKRGNKRTDFGRGFYLGSSFEMAKTWALDRFPPNGEAPTIICYEVDDAVFSGGALDLLRFDAPSKEWLEFVKLNRRKDLSQTAEPRHSHDMVFGHIANDMAADTIEAFVKEEIGWEEALKQIKTVPDVFQLSLHTPLSLEYIKVLKYWQLVGDEWKQLES